MRIGIDARLYKETGVGRYIRNLLNHLSRIDQKNEYLIFIRDNISKSELYSLFKCTIIPVDIKWHSFSEQIKFPFLLKKYNLDLVHFTYFSMPILYRGKFVITIHDITNLKFKTGKASTYPYLIYQFKHLAYQFVLYTSLKNASKIITPSETVKNQIGEMIPKVRNKIIVTYEGGLELTNKKQKKFDFEPFILYVGNVYPHKNIENGILTIKQLNLTRKNPVRLVIVSREDFFLKRIKEFIKKEKQEKNIIFLGQIDDYELLNLYQRAECLFFPSQSEGFGLPLVEAMQNQCLICCSDISVFREICKHIPFYFNPQDVGDMANVLKKVLNLGDNEKMKLKKLGIERAQYFSWNKMAKQTLDIYKEAVK